MEPYDLYEYKGNKFQIYEEIDYFIVVVDNKSYMLNSYADVNEFIQYYNMEDK